MQELKATNNMEMDPRPIGPTSSDSVQDTSTSAKKICDKKKSLNIKTCRELLEEMVEDIVLKTCFKVHRALKFGYFAIDEYIVQDGNFILHNVPPTNDAKNHDLLARAASSKKPSHINCPHCKRKLGTNRFAPHLNSCMGEGGRQNKERNAKRNCQTYDSGDDDDDDDYSDSGKKKKKKGKSQRKKTPFVKGKSGVISMQIHVFLGQKCGVISRKSKSMCNNTLKCSIHSDEQRREVRRSLLKCEPDPNVHIDVDTVDEVSRSPSPVDISILANPAVPRVKLEDVYATSEHPRPNTTTFS